MRGEDQLVRREEIVAVIILTPLLSRCSDDHPCTLCRHGRST
jgi:hypothetical protein